MIGKIRSPTTVTYLKALILIIIVCLVSACLFLSTSTTVFSVPKVFSFDEDRKLFVVPITDNERAIFIKLMKTFQRVVPSNFTYFLHGGTLLGSYRHHGMIPWDDDLDICVREKNKAVLLETLRSLEPEYNVTTKKSTLWKFYHHSSRPTRKKWGAWPFIDIFFYAENETHIWDTNPSIKHLKHKKTQVFPLVLRPFMDMLLPTPKNTRRFLSKLFDVDLCVSNYWSHKFQNETERVVKIPCIWLENDFEFVHSNMLTEHS